MRSLIGSASVICKGAILWSIIIITAPFILIKECTKKIFTTISIFMTHIKSVISSKTDHATEPSKDAHALLQHADETSFNNKATDNAKNEPASESLHDVMQSDKQQSND